MTWKKSESLEVTRSVFTARPWPETDPSKRPQDRSSCPGFHILVTISSDARGDRPRVGKALPYETISSKSARSLGGDGVVVHPSNPMQGVQADGLPPNDLPPIDLPPNDPPPNDPPPNHLPPNDGTWSLRPLSSRPALRVAFGQRTRATAMRPTLQSGSSPRRAVW